MTEFPVMRMNGASNEFYLIDVRDIAIDDYAQLARRLCGDGASDPADGLLLVLPSKRSDARMRMFNPDGSEAEMCGNGVRCVARYLSEHDGFESATIETLAGPIAVTVLEKAPVFEVRVLMGEPHVEDARELTIGGVTYPYIAVDIGNPHVVIFTDDVAAIDLANAGPAISTHPVFPNGTNVHFVEIVDAHAIRVRHWERGAGATAACGTGGVASAAAAIRAHQVASPVDVRVPGGDLVVEWTPGEGAYMTGNAVREYERVERDGD